MGWIARVHADDDLLAEGVQLFRAGRFERSLTVLEGAKRACDPTAPSPGVAQVHIYIGLNHATLKREGPARQAFAAALRCSPVVRITTARFKPEIVRLFDEVRREVRGRLHLESDLPGASVMLDGRSTGSTPLSLELPVGRYRVEIRHEESDERHVEEVLLHADQSVRVVAALRPVRAQEVFAEPRRVAPRAKRSRHLRTVSWIVGGVAVIAAGISIGCYASADATYEKAREEHDAWNQEQREDARASILSKDRAATALGVAAGVLAGTAVSLFLIDLFRAPGTRSDRRASLSTASRGLVLRF